MRRTPAAPGQDEMPLRIAIVTQAYRPAVGGVTEHVDATARELRARGHHVAVVTSNFQSVGSDAETDREGDDDGARRLPARVRVHDRRLRAPGQKRRANRHADRGRAPQRVRGRVRR